MRARFSSIPAFVAAAVWGFQPLLCDLTHSLQGTADSVEPGKHIHVAHCHNPAEAHVHRHSSCSHTHSDGCEAAGGQAVVSAPEHCCGGHDQAPVTLAAKVKALDQHREITIWIGAQSTDSTRAETAFPISEQTPLIASAPTSQGKLCALLGRWLI